MGLFRKLYGEALEPRIRAAANIMGEFHGSVVRDLFVEYARGRFSVDTHAEKLLQELVEEGVLETLQRAPTVSQAAFAGLQYDNRSYRALPWGPGTVEHHWYRFRQTVLSSFTVQ